MIGDGRGKWYCTRSDLVQPLDAGRSQLPQTPSILLSKLYRLGIQVQFGLKVPRLLPWLRFPLVTVQYLLDVVGSTRAVRCCHRLPTTQWAALRPYLAIPKHLLYYHAVLERTRLLRPTKS